MSRSHRPLLLTGQRAQLILLGKRFAAHERRHERFNVDGRLRGTILHDDGRATEVLINDISKGGLSYFVSPKDAPQNPDGRVVMKISIGDSSQIVECAFTLRDRRVDARGYFRHGLEAVNSPMNLLALAKLEEFVRRPALPEAA